MLNIFTFILHEKIAYVNYLNKMLGTSICSLEIINSQIQGNLFILTFLVYIKSFLIKYSYD